MSKIYLQNIVWQEGEHYVAQCLNVEVSSFGNSKEEALTNLNEALELYYEDNEDPEFTFISKPEIIGSTLEYT